MVHMDNLVKAIANEAYCKTCTHLMDEDCDCDVVFTGYEPKDEPQRGEPSNRIVEERATPIRDFMVNGKPKDEPQTKYKKWETKPNADIPTEITTCVGVAMALIEDEPQTERSE